VLFAVVVQSTTHVVVVKAGKSLATRISMLKIFANTPLEIVALGQNLSIVITSERSIDLS
jgi:hypothetical protein